MDYDIRIIIGLIIFVFLGSVLGLLCKILWSKRRGFQHRENQKLFAALHDLAPETIEISQTKRTLTKFPLQIIPERIDAEEVEEKEEEQGEEEQGEEEQFNFRIFSTEKPKKLATKTSDSIDPALGRLPNNAKICQVQSANYSLTDNGLKSSSIFLRLATTIILIVVLVIKQIRFLFLDICFSNKASLLKRVAILNQDYL